MGELGLTYRGIDDFLRDERSKRNLEPVSPAEDRKVRRMLASGRIEGGRCKQCGDPRPHAHGTVS